MLTLLPAASRGQTAYITNIGYHTVSAVDVATNRLIASIPVGDGPEGIAATPDGRTVYVANTSSGTISVIDTKTNKVSASIPLGSSSRPSWIAASPDGTRVYVVTTAGTSVIDTATNTVSGNISVAAGGGLAISPDSTTLYLTGGQTGTGGKTGAVYVVSTTTGAVIATIPVGGPGGASWVVLTPSGNEAFVTNAGLGGESVSVIDTSTYAVTATVPVNPTPAVDAVTPDGSTLYLTNEPDLVDPSLVSVISTATNSVIATIPVGMNPFGIAVTPDGTEVYVANENSNTVSVIDTSTNSVLTNIPIREPYLIAIAPSTATAPPAPLPSIAQDLGAGTVGDCHCADPISVGTGNLFEQVTDYSTAGQNPLSFTRYYNSLAHTVYGNTFANTLGTNWRGTYDSYLHISPATGQATTVAVERADGQVVGFTFNGSTWTTSTDVDATLTQSGSTWTLQDHNDTLFVYIADGNGEGLLNSITLRNGYTQSLTYNGNQLTTVTDSYNRHLGFSYYSNGMLETLTTPDTLILTYGFNEVSAGNQLTSVSYNTSPATSQTYIYGDSSLPFALTGILDENNNRFATWTYDSQGRALSSQHAAGASTANLTKLTYNSNGTTTVTNAFGVADTYTFSLQHVRQVMQISRAKTRTTAAATRSFAYDSNGYLASTTDWNGNQTTYVNDSHGDPTIINEAVGSSVARTTTIVYDPVFPHLPDSVTTPGLSTSYTYDANGDVLTRTDTDMTTTAVPYSNNGVMRVWTYEWNNFLLSSVQSPRTDVTAVTKFGYDATGALTSITDALSHITSITQHTGGGRPLTMVDANNVTTTLGYDARQRLTSSAVTTGSGVLTTTYTIDPTGETDKVTLPDNSFLSYAYDNAHRLTRVTDALGNYMTYTLDALGDQTKIDTYDNGNSLHRKHSATFDALGRMLSDVGGVGQMTTYTYDPDGNALTITDPLRHKTTRVFDALRRLSSSTDANHGLTQLNYDAHDRILTLADPNSNVTSYVYDGFGDAIQQTSPDSGVTVYYFDGDGNLTSKTDALGIVTNQEFDSLDRPLTTIYPADSTLTVVYTYDQTGTGFGFGIGRLTSVTDNAGALVRSYDERGNMLTEQRTNNGNTYITTYTYDPASRTASITYPDGAISSNQYNSAGYLQQISDTPAGSITNQTVAYIAHVPFGPLNSVTYGNGISEAWTFDSDYRPTNITDTVSSTNVQKLTYSYDAANNLKIITDAVTASNTQRLSYDVLNRIHTASSGAKGYGSLAYTYDSVGNLQTLSMGTTTTTYTYAGTSNQLVSYKVGTVTPVSTNANGNITSIPAVGSSTEAIFSYNAANRLASVTGTTSSVAFAYDAFGRRFSKTDSSSTPILYFYAQDGSLIEENNGGSYTDYLYADGRPVANLQPGNSLTADQVNYVLADRLGTPQLVSNSSAATVWSITYRPYGQGGIPVSGIVNNLRLPGQNYDLETGFHYNGFRDYMPNIGRYLETDPIGLAGGLNPYLYAKGNPGKYIDPTGRGWIDSLLALLDVKTDMAKYQNNINVQQNYYANIEDSNAAANNVAAASKAYQATPVNSTMVGFDSARALKPVVEQCLKP